MICKALAPVSAARLSIVTQLSKSIYLKSCACEFARMVLRGKPGRKPAQPDNLESVQRFVAGRRDHHGTAEGYATTIDCSADYVDAMAVGRHMPGGVLLIRMAAEAGVSVDRILGLDSSAPRNPDIFEMHRGLQRQREQRNQLLAGLGTDECWPATCEDVRTARQKLMQTYNPHVRSDTLIAQSCSTKACMSPRHLYVASNDARKKIGPDEVQEIRKLHASGVKGRIIAAKYQVSGATISKIVNRLRWADVA